MDAFGIENHGYSPLISQKYVVKGDFEVYDGMDLLHHAMLNTLPNINKDGGKDEHGKTIRIPDFEARQKADTLITEIRQAFVEWLHAQPDDFKERLTDLYNRKFNCYVRPRYDGSHQQFPGLDLRGLGIDDLYPSQKDAIWMIKQNGGIVISTAEGLPLSTCLYETASAVGTVGLTLGITPQLGVLSQLILIVLMYLGRVGGLTLIYAAISNKNQSGAKLPLENITVG